MMNSEVLDQLISSFLAEAQEFIQLLETNLLEIETANTVEGRVQAVKTMFRAAHSLKGSALMFGFEDLSIAAHCLEDCFAILRDRVDFSQLEPITVTNLLQGVDCLKFILNNLGKGEVEVTQHKEAISVIKAELEAKYGAENEAPPVPMLDATNAEVLQVIFEHDLPPVLSQFETEICQVEKETLPQTIDAVLKIYRQLSGLAEMLQLPDFGEVAESIATLVETPDLSVELLQEQGWLIAQNLQIARTQVLQGQHIVVESLALSNKTANALDSKVAVTELSTDVKISNIVSHSQLAKPLAEVSVPIVNIESSSTISPTTTAWHRPTIRVDMQQLNELVNLVGELVINRTNLDLQKVQLRSEVKQIRQKISTLHQAEGQLREEYDRMTVPAQTQLQQYGQQFDALEMDQYTEFHSTAQSVIETTQAIAQSANTVDGISSQFERSTDRLRRITEQLQSQLMQLRVVPFSRVVDHLPRALRDLSRTYQKDVSLLLLGRETKIDQSLLEALRDPIVHLVRNAFDHGIEPPELRQRLGKPINGKIEIEARHQGGQTFITISDDGRGIDPEAIRTQIVEKGFVTLEQSQQLSLNELYEFLFLPGFSTATEVNELSGRGVGLDVVRDNLRQVRGTVKVDSRLGEGTRFTLKLPLMLAITQALMVKTNHNIVAVPMDAVEEILHIQANQIQMAGHQSMLWWRERFIRLLHLPELLHYSTSPVDLPSPEPSTQENLPALILNTSNGFYAIAVERLLGQQEIVVKPLPAPLKKPPGIVGSTILGSGQVVTILDVDDLVDRGTSQAGVAVAKNDKHSHSATSAATAQPQVLVVDDSYAVRQLLSLTLTRANYRVVQAKDGQDALDRLQDGLHCNLIITDIEMPRMDGFELVRSLKSSPIFSHIPTAILTSRSGAKHRQTALDLGAARYFTKPYHEVQLLEEIDQLLNVS